MKTAETVALEKAIRRATYKMGTFGCYEVTIGYGGKERVDYMTYDTKGIFRCYEVKVSKADFHSAAVKSFVGHYNYYVLTRELYDQVKGEIPDWVGVYIGDYCAKKAKKQDLSDRECDTPTRVLANGRGFLRHGRTPQRTITSPLHPVTGLPLSRLLGGFLF